MKKLFVVSILQVIVSVSAFSQNGYKINIKLLGTSSGNVVTLAIYKGTYSQAYIIDSVKVSEPNQTISFSNKKKILGGVYRLGFTNDKQNNRNIFVDNNNSINLWLTGNNMEALDSRDNLNKLFLKYQQPGLSEEEKDLCLKKIAIQFPSSVGLLFSQIEIKKRAAAKQGSDSAGRLAVKRDYFKNMDLGDKRIQILPNIYSFLFEYIKLSPLTITNYNQNVDDILKKMRCTDRNYFFYVNWFFENIKFYQSINLNGSYRYIYNTYLNKEECSKIDPAFFTRATNGLSALSELKLGIEVPGFAMQDSLGNVYPIAGLLSKSKFTFLAFYDPDCEHCREIMPKVAAFFKQKNYPKELVQLIAFRNTAIDAKWRSFIETSHLEQWLNVRPQNNDLGYMAKLQVYKNPSFFLLDNDGKIELLKYDENALTAAIH